jgi:hypothetical protein
MIDNPNAEDALDFMIRESSNVLDSPSIYIGAYHYLERYLKVSHLLTNNPVHLKLRDDVCELVLKYGYGSENGKPPGMYYIIEPKWREANKKGGHYAYLETNEEYLLDKLLRFLNTKPVGDCFSMSEMVNHMNKPQSIINVLCRNLGNLCSYHQDCTTLTDDGYYKVELLGGYKADENKIIQTIVNNDNSKKIQASGNARVSMDSDLKESMNENSESKKTDSVWIKIRDWFLKPIVVAFALVTITGLTWLLSQTKCSQNTNQDTSQQAPLKNSDTTSKRLDCKLPHYSAIDR